MNLRTMLLGAALGLAALLPAAAPPAWCEPPRAAGQLWTCGMHPQVIRDQPGTCPICGMALTPLQNSHDASASVLYIDPVVVQNMGVRVAPVVSAPLHQRVRAVGYLTEPVASQLDINLRVSGWIERLYADVEGMHVARGDRLFDLYSPDLQAAIEEWIAARRAAQGDTGLAEMAASVRRKLELLGLRHEQIDQLGRLDRAPATVTFYSPMAGHVIDKRVVAGAAVRAGEPVLRLSDRSTMWLDLQIYEQDLALVRLGENVHATVASLPGVHLEGTISFVHPHVEPLTRTALARVVLDNHDGQLRQGMYASAEIRAQLAEEALQVPREAVIDSGVRQVVFVALDEGRFEPRAVTMGAAGEDGQVQILSGLAAGERVVRSGQFLLDAESRLREAIRKHLDDKQRPAARAAEVDRDPRDH